MKLIMKWWQMESATIVGIVLALVNASVIHGTIGKILGAVLPLIGAGAVRQTVWTPASVAGKVGEAATAAIQAASPATVGAEGAVTAAGQAIADQVTATVAPSFK